MRHEQFDYVKDPKNFKHYPCYREFYEAQYSCIEDAFEYLLELAFARRATDTFEAEYQNAD